MAFSDYFKISKDEGKTEDVKLETASIKEMVQELGVAREGVVGTYDAEENPDDLGPETYIQMQNNDGEVQAIVRMLSLPIISTPLHIVPAANDQGERDFIETIFKGPESKGGMTTPLSFIVADMTRAIFEGFRFYEKVARVIVEGPHEGMVGWKKLAPRDAQTIELKADDHGGFDGSHQQARFEGETYSVDIPPEKSMLFTFQKEKHWLYGESILKTAHYHYEKKHKLYYIAHKKAEIESMGVKILEVDQSKTEDERESAEEAADRLGVNSRITLPPGINLRLEKGSGGYDPLPLIEHHNTEMCKSALTQVLEEAQYPYPYGDGTQSSQVLVMALNSIMRQMETTINQYAIAPLIDWNFDSGAYPKVQFEEMSDATQVFLKDVFETVMDSDKQLPEGFAEEVFDETAKALNLKWAYDEDKKEKVEEKHKNKEAARSFEQGKLEKANEIGINAPPTPLEIKDKLHKVPPEPKFHEECYKLGQTLADVSRDEDLS